MGYFRPARRVQAARGGTGPGDLPGPPCEVCVTSRPVGAPAGTWQHLFGASAVATIPVLILFALIERRVVGGLTAGSIR